MSGATFRSGDAQTASPARAPARADRRGRPRLVSAVVTLALLVSLALLGLGVAAAAELRVLAAASLAGAFGDLAHRFEAAHPGVRVRLVLAGSQQLAAQIEQGAPGDVFASADTRWMDDVRDRGLLAGEARVFAHNRLVVIVPRTNPGHVGALADLTRRGVKLVIAADAVPAGHYARELFARLELEPGYPPGYARRALANVVSEEENVKAVAGKVQLGEADAGVVYRSDVTPALARYVRAIEPPDAANVTATYPIAALRDAPSGDLARAFVELVTSADGQAALARHGLLPASTPAP